jgi:NADPH2:quinone reductase
VCAVGDGVTRLRVGQRVLALLGWGGYAEAVPAPDPQVFPIPDAMSFEEAAAFGIIYQTSYCALVHRAGLRAGEWLLVHAAAGGVGLAAVQLGKALGARVIATAGSDAKLDVARQSGADVLLNYQTEDWVERVKAVTGGSGADVVFDPVGGDVFDGSSRCLAFEGRLLVIGFAGSRIPTIAANRILLKNVAVVGVYWGLYQTRGSPRVAEWMDALFRLYEAKQIRPVIYRAYPLPEAAQALAALGGRESYGKVVLVP